MGSLLLEDYAVRLSGQDSQRGTFSQRHLVLHDVETGETHTPLDGLDSGRLEVFNSPLTEAGVMGETSREAGHRQFQNNPGRGATPH